MLSSLMPSSRIAITGLLLVAVTATSACSWFRKDNELYTQSAQSRPLEVPPDLDMPSTDTAMGAPAGSVTASGQAIAPQAPAAGAAPAAPAVPAAPGASAAPMAAPTAAPAASASGFTTPGSRDEVFGKVGTALEGIEGVSIASRAQLLGVFDVNYEGNNFLVRVSEAEAGAYVSAVDPRGMPASGESPVKLIAAVQAAIGGN